MTRADDLLAQIDRGDYTPLPLDRCDQSAPRDHNPQRIRHQQLVVFDTPDGQVRVPQLPDPALEGKVEQLAELLADQLVERLGPLAAATWRLAQEPDGRTPLATLRQFAQVHALSGYRDDLPEEATRTLVRQHLARERPQLQAALHAQLAKLLPAVTLPSTKAPVELAELLRPVLRPLRAADLDQRLPHHALLVDLEQSWELLGYTRGELVQGLTLAPGEQLQLEVHYWDKRTARREEELAEEQERRLDQRLTERDSLDVVREIAAQQGRKVSAGLKLSLPIPLKGSADGGALDGGIEQTMEQSLSTLLKSTQSQVRETVLQSVDSLKQQRKLRIEVARESGRENKQVRQLANSNRGRALHCRYFELLANYRVQLRIAALKPCLLLPLPRLDISPRWVLAHESELDAVLLAPSVRPGFAAARRLELKAQMALLQAAREAQRAGSHPRETELTALRNDIRDALETLEEAADSVREALRRPALVLAAGLGAPALWTALVLVLGSLLPLRRTLALAMLQADAAAFAALQQFAGAAAGSGTAAAAFSRLLAAFGSATAASPQAVENGLRQSGIGALLARLLVVVAELAQAVADDAGLRAALKAAGRLLQSADDGGYSGTGSGDVATSRADRCAEMWADAEAAMEYQRLSDHLMANRLHYAQALWLGRHPDDRALRLRTLAPPGMAVSPEVVGFFADRVAHPLLDPAALAADLNLSTLADRVLKQLPAAPDCLVTLPTQGTELVTQLGHCEACEDYILDSRRIELEKLQAEADQQGAEARRRQLRLEQSPPALGDFDDRDQALLLATRPAAPDHSAP